MSTEGATNLNSVRAVYKFTGPDLSIPLVREEQTVETRTLVGLVPSYPGSPDFCKFVFFWSSRRVGKEGGIGCQVRATGVGTRVSIYLSAKYWWSLSKNNNSFL